MTETEILRTITINIRSGDYEVIADYVVVGPGPDGRQSANPRRIGMCAKTLPALVDIIKTAVESGAKSTPPPALSAGTGGDRGIPWPPCPECGAP